MRAASRDKSALSIYRIRILSTGEISIIARFLAVKFRLPSLAGSSVNRSILPYRSQRNNHMEGEQICTIKPLRELIRFLCGILILTKSEQLQNYNELFIIYLHFYRFRMFKEKLTLRPACSGLRTRTQSLSHRNRAKWVSGNMYQTHISVSWLTVVQRSC